MTRDVSELPTSCKYRGESYDLFSKMTFRALLYLLVLSSLPGHSCGFAMTNAQDLPQLEARFEIDTAKAYAESSFPFKPKQLIEETKLLFSPEIGLGLIVFVLHH
jgi:hypothetical protein